MSLYQVDALRRSGSNFAALTATGGGVRPRSAPPAPVGVLVGARRPCAPARCALGFRAFRGSGGARGLGSFFTFLRLPARGGSVRRAAAPDAAAAVPPLRLPPLPPPLAGAVGFVPRARALRGAAACGSPLGGPQPNPWAALRLFAAPAGWGRLSAPVRPAPAWRVPAAPPCCGVRGRRSRCALLFRLSPPPAPPCLPPCSVQLLCAAG